MEEAEAHLWEAMEAYNLAKEDSTSLSNRVKFLPCLELLKDILEQQGGPGRLAKAEELLKELEESKAGVEAMYAAALEETRRKERREGKERRRRRRRARRSAAGRRPKRSSLSKRKGPKEGGVRRTTLARGRKKARIFC